MAKVGGSVVKAYEKAKGRTAHRSAPFVGLPNEMLDSRAFRALSPHGTRLLVAFARQFRGNNNASLIVPFSIAKQWGFSNERTYYGALRELSELGFIEMTVPAIRRGRPSAARFALTWLSIHEPVGEVRHDLTPTERASNDWRNWVEKRPAKLPVKSRKATGRSASYVQAKLPVKNGEVAKATGKTASQKPVFGDLRPADLPVDLISTMQDRSGVDNFVLPEPLLGAMP